jgi:predicted amidohydrolase
MERGVAAAQTASVAGDVGANVARHVAVAERAAKRGVGLLVFPELSLTGYELALARRCVVDPGGAEVRALRELAVRTGMVIVAGAPVAGEAGAVHAGALAFGADGRVVVYTKVYVHESEMAAFAVGSGGPLVRAGGARVGLAICRDAAFPEHAAAARERGAQVYAAGVMLDEEGYGRKAPLMPRYAREHGMAVLLANYAGQTGGEISAGKSTIWDERGEVVAASAGNGEELVVAEKRNGAWAGAVVEV